MNELRRFNEILENQHINYFTRGTLESLKQEYEKALSEIKQLQSKIAALSITVADNDIDEVKRLLPLSGEQVVREIQAEAVSGLRKAFPENTPNAGAECLTNIGVCTFDQIFLSLSIESDYEPVGDDDVKWFIDLDKLRNPEQEKV